MERVNLSRRHEWFCFSFSQRSARPEPHTIDSECQPIRGRPVRDYSIPRLS
jgi:hypothetical protein